MCVWLTERLSGERFLLPALARCVQSSEATWQKGRVDSYKLSSDTRVHTVVPTHVNTHMCTS